LDLPVQYRLFVLERPSFGRGLPRFEDRRRIGEIAMQFNESTGEISA